MEWQRRLIQYTPTTGTASAWTAYLMAESNVDASNVLFANQDVLVDTVFICERTILDVVLIPLYRMRPTVDEVITAADSVLVLEKAACEGKRLLPTISYAHSDVQRTTLSDCMHMVDQLLKMMRCYAVLEDANVTTYDAHLSAANALWYARRIQTVYYTENQIVLARLLSDGLVLPRWISDYMKELKWVSVRWRVKACQETGVPPPADTAATAVVPSATPLLHGATLLVAQQMPLAMASPRVGGGAPLLATGGGRFLLPAGGGVVQNTPSMSAKGPLLKSYTGALLRQ